MKKWKNRILIVLMVFSVGSISACTTTYLYMKKWKGRTVEELYSDFGTPDEFSDSKEHHSAYTWISTWTDDGKTKTCRKTFYTRNYGHGEVIVDTAYSNCPFLTIK